MRIKIFVIFLLSALVIHFGLSLVYSFRDHVPYKLAHVADRYIVPSFHSNWKLFAPDLPEYNSELEFRMAVNNEWSDWADASAAYGFGKESYVETVEQGFLTQLNWQILNNLYTRNGEKQFDRVMQSPAYASAMYFVMKLYQLKISRVTPEMVEVRVRYNFTPEPGSGKNGEVILLEFPIYVPE